MEKQMRLVGKDGSQFTIDETKICIKEVPPSKDWVNFHMVSGEVIHCIVDASKNNELVFDKIFR